MILSVSRRTDIPAFFGKWFMNRLKEGFVYVRNPFNFHAVSKISLNKAVVDCIVFWTKDATNFINYLPEINDMGYKYYFQYTITPYDKTIEPNLRDKNLIIENFKKLSNQIGKEKVIWRYDPILLTEKIDINWHAQRFEEMCKELADYTDVVIISFLDEYKKLDKSKIRSLTFEEMTSIAKEFNKTAMKYNLKLKTCAEGLSESLDLEKASCIDKYLIEKICECSLNVKKDKNQRSECLCAESIDIGEYDTCNHQCLYCYANNHCKNIQTKLQKHNHNSPLLIGEITNDDKITERKVFSLKNLQISI